MFPKSRAPRAVFAAACAALLLAACGSEQAPADPSDAAATPAAAGEVHLYTTREPGLILPLLYAFTSRSGLQVNTLFPKDGLLEALPPQGTRSHTHVTRRGETQTTLDI